MGKLAVIALGGNALLRDDEAGSIEQQEANTLETIENLVYLLKEDYNLVITHGNGPQVGNILMRNDAGEQLYNIVPMPLDICVADSQGGIGYMIERMIRNVMTKHGIGRDVVTLITMVLVDPDDKAFSNPSKRIGKLYSLNETEKLRIEKDWDFKPSSKKKGYYSRVVPSPEPLGIVNIEMIKHFVSAGAVVIAAGGGGIPVYYDEKGNIRTVNAVIDKDLASAVLASQIGAEEFYILTDVPYIYKDFGLPTQEKLEFLNRADTLHYLEKGTFAEGSMEPKIRASLRFVEAGGKKSVITEAKKLEDRNYGSKITLNYDSDKH
ncbi:MAG: carbamate kinase [Prolixibacteraceae bacterium]|nr:carbamate kinase [Prolixibacteraceae bacterium]